VTKYFQNYQNAPSEAWFKMNEELVSTHLTIDATKQLLSLGAIPVNNARKADNGVNLSLSQQRCNNYNTEGKGCTIEQKIGRPCARLHACNICKKTGHPMFKCPQNMSLLPKSAGN